MARPKKAVVDYFPHYCNHGKTMFTIESNYGNDGYAFWFKLLEILGATEHHYIDCNNIDTWEFLLAKTRFNEDNANDILNLLARLGAINKELWENRIIRSDNFIENLQTVYNRRTVNVLTNSEILDLCMQKPPLNEINVNKNPQSKVKYSKVYSSSSSYSNPHGKVFQFYEQNIGLISSHQSDVLNSYLDDGLSPELVIEAVKDSLGSDNKWKYLNSILKKCMEQKIHTLEQYNAAKTEHEKRKNKDPTTRKKSWVERKEEEYQRTANEIIQNLKKEGILTDE